MRIRLISRSSANLFFLSLYAFFLQTLLFKSFLFIDDYLMATSVIGNSLIGFAIGAALSITSADLDERRNSRGFFALFCSGWLAAVGLLASPRGEFLVPWIWPAFAATAYLTTNIFRQKTAAVAYCTEMIGGATAVLALIVAVPTIGVENSFLVLQVLMAVAMSMNVERRWRLAANAAVAVALGIAIFNLHTDALNLARITPCKDNVQPQKIYCWGNLGKVETHDNLGQRIDVQSTSKAKRIFYDGYSNDMVYDEETPLYRKDPRIIDGLQSKPRVLVVGAAAEGVLKPLKAQTDAGQIIAYEQNPSIVSLMQNELFEASSAAYEGIDIRLGNVIPYFLSTSEKFDLVTLMNTHNVKTVNFVGGPEYLHTIESAKALIGLLKPGGFISIEERDSTEPATFAFFRIVHTFQAALRGLGVENPEDSTYLYMWRFKVHDMTPRPDWDFHQALFKNGPITQEDLSRIRSWVNLPDGSTLAKTTRIQIDTNLKEMYEKQVPELKLITNDRPFPYDDRSENRQLFSALTLPLTTLAGFAALLMLLNRERETSLTAPERLELAAAGLSGFGFLLLEIIFMERYSRFIPSQTASYLAILFTMLACAGLGGLISIKLKFQSARVLIVSGIVSIFFHQKYLEDLLASSLASPQTTILLLMTSVGLTAFLLGSMLPYVIHNRKNSSQATVSWLITINLMASGFAAIVAPSLVSRFGYSASFAIVLIVYLVALVCLPTSKAQSSSRA